MTGQRDNHTVLSSRLIECIYRIRQKYAVQHFQTFYITSAHAEHNKRLVLQSLLINTELLPVSLAGIQCLTLRKKYIFGGFDCL